MKGGGVNIPQMRDFFRTERPTKQAYAPTRSLPQLFADKKTEFLEMCTQTDFFGW